MCASRGNAQGLCAGDRVIASLPYNRTLGIECRPLGVFCLNGVPAVDPGRHHGWVAQLAEQWTENPRVGGSIPPPAIAPFS